MFDITNMLVQEVLQGKFHEGKIPREVRDNNETAGAANRRRERIKHLMRQHPQEVAKAVKAIGVMYEEKLVKRYIDFINPSTEQVVAFRALSVSLKELALRCAFERMESDFENKIDGIPSEEKVAV
jgi:hypothetical protein